MVPRWAGFTLAGLMLLVPVGCGGSSATSDTPGSATGATDQDTSGERLAPVSAACLSAMTGFADSYNMSDADQQPYLDATFTACKSPGEWNAAAEQFRSYTDDRPYAIGGNASADSVRQGFCGDEESGTPACTG